MTGRYLTAAVLEDLEQQMTKADLAVLRRVSNLRFVTGGQLARMHFAGGDDPGSNARAARRALLRLTRLGCLSRLPRRVGGVRAGSAGFVYALGIAGQRLSEDRGWQPTRRRRRSQSPGTLFLNHTLQVAELHTLLIEADRSRHLELLELTAEPACWRRYGGVGGQGQATLKPDSFVRLGAGDYEDSYFMEVDMGSHGTGALERKLRDYLAYEVSGIEQKTRGVFPRTLWLTPDESRAEVIEACVGRLPNARQALFTVAPFVDLMTTLQTSGD